MGMNNWATIEPSQLVLAGILNGLSVVSFIANYQGLFDLVWCTGSGQNPREISLYYGRDSIGNLMSQLRGTVDPTCENTTDSDCSNRRDINIEY